MKDVKALFKHISDHLEEDIRGYEKERKYLKKEMKEDRQLIKKVRGKKSDSKKKSSKK